MAAFSSYQHLPFHLTDSVFQQNKMPEFSQEPNNTHCFPQFYQYGEQRFLDVSVRESSSSLEQSNTKVSLSTTTTSSTTTTTTTNDNNKLESVTTYNYKNNNKQSTDSSSSLILDEVESGEQVRKKMIPMDNNKRNSAQSKDTREQLGKSKKKKKSNGGIKNEEEEEEEEEEKKNIDDRKKKKKKVKVAEEEAPTGYIHVRARRGQATDSHSLAERVRREKISERMKLLQALVPGCDKVTGKALMLDEIINYVQSLQNQVEFLSMKLASVDPMFYDFGMDLEGFMVKPADQANMQHGSHNQPTGTLINTFTTPNNYHPLLDTSTSLAFQQGQMPNILSQSNGQMLWEVDEQRQKFINQCGLFNNFGSFH
ncbi:hypothetical protein LguiB_023028 [Lonicera macranthoides]